MAAWAPTTSTTPTLLLLSISLRWPCRHSAMLMGEELTEGDRGQQFRGLLSKPASRFLLNFAMDDHRECFRAEFETCNRQCNSHVTVL